MLDDAFYAVLEFGTGGRRGQDVPGRHQRPERPDDRRERPRPGRLRRPHARGRTPRGRASIARDTRHNSPEFAELCARVLAAAGFKVYLFPEPRSTPLLSFAVRHLELRRRDHDHRVAQPAVGQRLQVLRRDRRPGHPARRRRDHRLRRGRLRPRDPREAASTRPSRTARSSWSGREVDEAYIAAVVRRVGQPRPRPVDRLHADARRRRDLGRRRAHPRRVRPRSTSSPPSAPPTATSRTCPGTSPTPRSPRPSTPSIAEAKATGADLVLASDPDADRIGVAVPVTGDPKGEWTTLDGNQIGVLLAAFVMKQTKAQGRLRPDHYLVTTLVTSQMARALAEREGVRIEDDLLVGFKWIGQRIDAGRARRIPVRVRGVARLPEGDPRPRQGRRRRRPALRRAGRRRSRTAGRPSSNTSTTSIIDVGHYGERLINKTLEGREGPRRSRR